MIESCGINHEQLIDSLIIIVTMVLNESESPEPAIQKYQYFITSDRQIISISELLL